MKFLQQFGNNFVLRVVKLDYHDEHSINTPIVCRVVLIKENKCQATQLFLFGNICVLKFNCAFASINFTITMKIRHT